MTLGGVRRWAWLAYLVAGAALTVLYLTVRP